MGCFKSKHKYSVQTANSAEQADSKRCGGCEMVMVDPSSVEIREDSLLVNAALLSYAQRLSEDVVHTAVKQWMEIECRYRDIPYIESGAP